MALIRNQKIELPFQDDKVIDIDLANLPEPTEIIAMFQEQNYTINYWTLVATEYYRQNKHDAFELILETGLKWWDVDRTRKSLSERAEAEKDRIKALDLLAIFYVRKVLSTKSREKRRDFSARATQKFTEVDKSESISKHGPEYQFHLLGRAYLCLIEGRNDQADQQFNFVLQQQQQSGQPENVPSLLGRACIEFNKKEASGKRTALSLYKRALQVCPNCPADVRLGMAICFYKLNMLEKAEEAFAKALSLDPKCVGALTGLAVIELNKKTNASIKRGMDYLSKAFKIDPTDAMVLTLLADHFFYANEHDKVLKLATRAMENTENESMQAQACYQLARAFHKKKDYDNAFEYYYKATQFGGSQFFLAFYGLGQMYIHRGEVEPAIQAFETVLKTNPDNHETLKVLASLYAMSTHQSKKEQARNFLRKVTEKRPDDVEAWVELASLTEQHNTPLALSAYKTAINLYETRSQKVPPELYNNIAALLFSTEDLQESEKYYNLAVKRCQEEMSTNELHYGSIIYTIKYNMGRLYEAKHDLNEAEKTYKNILVQHPMYLDCYLRLGCMERDRGLLFDASDKFKETFRIDADNADAWTLIGNLHFSKLELTPCQKKFERILEKNKHQPDVYSLLSVGNVWLQSQYLVKDLEKQKLQRGRALTFFNYGLRYDFKNIYAASGIGCILALNGLYNEARDVFSQVREATADFPDVWVNIAHIYVEQKQYVAAVQMYENCLKKFYNNSNTELLSYIARALFKANKLAECKKVLLKARYICPHDAMILLNLAKVLKTLARQTFEDRKSTYHEVVTAEYELKLAQTYFHHYADLKEKSKSEHDRGIDLLTAQIEERDCADLLIQVEKSIKHDALKRDEEETKRRKEHEEQLAKELARKAELEEKRQQESRQKREELENKRRELLKRQEEAKQKLLQEDSGVARDDGSEEIEHRGKRKKKAPKEGKKKEKKDKEREKADREDDESPPPERENKKYKSRAILSSDSSSSDEDQ